MRMVKEETSWDVAPRRSACSAETALGFIPRTTKNKQETVTSEVFLYSFVYVALPTLPITHKHSLNAP